MKIDVQELARVLTTAPHQFLGIAMPPAVPSHDSVCSMLGVDRTLNSFHYALHAAKDYWPNAKEFVIFGSDALVHPETPEELMRGSAPRYPAGMERLQTPVELLRFDGSDW